MSPKIPSILLATCLLTVPLRAETLSPLISGKNYEERTGNYIRYLATAQPRNPNFPKEAMPYYAARLQLGIDPAGTRAAIDKMLDATVKARPDPFNMHAVMHAYCLYRDAFTPEMREKIKRIVTTPNYGRPAGVSLNYELMRGGAGFLAARSGRISRTAPATTRRKSASAAGTI